jgi:hypothetical protein
MVALTTNFEMKGTHKVAVVARPWGLEIAAYCGEKRGLAIASRGRRFDPVWVSTKPGYS